MLVTYIGQGCWTRLVDSSGSSRRLACHAGVRVESLLLCSYNDPQAFHNREVEGPLEGVLSFFEEKKRKIEEGKNIFTTPRVHVSARNEEREREKG